LKKLFSEAEQSISDFENWIGNLKSESYYDVLDAEVSGLVFSDASFVERVQKSVKKFPKKQAIIEGGDRIFTYRQLWAQAQLIAKTLGNRAGQRIALRIDDKPNLIAAIIGVQLSGATVISLDVSDKASINMMLKDCDPGVVMYRDAAIDPKTRVAVSKTRKKVSWIEIPDIDDIGNTPIDQKLKLPKVDKNTIAHMFYTSGTTGHRKGVSISQSAYIAPANSLNRGMSYDETVREYVVGNISHAFPFGRVRAVLFVGGTVVLNNGGVQPRLVLNMLEASNCNAIGAPASVIIMLTARFRDAFAALSKQLNWIKMGTQAVPPEIKTSLLEMFPETKIFQQYGASESPRTVLNNIGTASTLETTGRVLPGYKVSIRDPEGKILLDRRQKGRVWLKGPHIATGYWRNKKKTNESFNDGWFITDDIGQLDDEGQLTLFGRVDEIINFGGQKLSPQDIENVLSKFLKNEKFVVFGVKDPSGLLGEVPAIVFEKGDTEFSEDADWPKKRIAITKEIGKTVPFIPKQAFKISKIPMTGSGKPKRKILSAMAQSNPG
jgi:acyl-CoA synthetase (AMP-forming)/AMP-acid ligase II